MTIARRCSSASPGACDAAEPVGAVGRAGAVEGGGCGGGGAAAGGGAAGAVAALENSAPASSGSIQVSDDFWRERDLIMSRPTVTQLAPICALSPSVVETSP